MKIEFEFDMNDLMSLQEHHLSQSVRMKRIRKFASLGIIAAFSVLLLKDYMNNKSIHIPVTVYGIFLLIWFLFFPKFIKKLQLKSIRKAFHDGDNSSLLGMHRITFEEESVHLNYPELESKLNWTGIKKFEETDAYIYLYTTTNSAVVIPKKKIIPDVIKLQELLKNRLGHLL